jgi:hypothetical protein
MGLGTRLAVVVFWLAMMGWLIVEKVLPPLLVGEPPSYQNIVDELRDDQPLRPVEWVLYWNGRPVGQSRSEWQRRDDESTRLISTVKFVELPLVDLAPRWLSTVLRDLGATHEGFRAEIRSLCEVDPLGEIMGFDTSVELGLDPRAVVISGEVVDRNLKLVVQVGELRYRTERYLPPDSLIADTFSPYTQLPNLREGQKWTQPVYSPFRPPYNPLVVLQATVERIETIDWNGERVKTHLVVYRADEGVGVGGAANQQGRVWVDMDGTVLRQELPVMDSRLTFERLPDNR